ncbi:MAG TPA: alpha/beta fold hydrolase [Acidimicrobiales bacterium]|nr:alpha/beta fold hydrolase [Acidimicrobiales bacterium]
MESVLVDRGDVRLYVEVGGDGPTVLLLHGWPDTGALWDEVAPALMRAGFRVAVPDLRGCGRSSKPDDVDAYQTHLLVGDVAAIIDSLDVERVHLVGHDWGANLAWATAAFRGDLVNRLVPISLGHPTAFCAGGLDQQVKSWYMLLFHFDGLGEAFLRQNDYDAMRRWVRHPRTEEIIAELERDGQMRTHLMWYRANVRPDIFVTPPPQLPRIQSPTMGVWSSGDFALGERQMTESGLFCDNGFTYLRLETFGHWIPLEAPAELSAALIEFFSVAS